MESKLVGDQVDSKKSLRILIATHSPLSKEFGAGQTAINLADAFRTLGHDVTLWSPHPMPNLPRRWQGLQSFELMRSKLDEFLNNQNYFNVIDCPSFLITKKVTQSTNLVIARSVQPDILYTMSNLFNSNNNLLKRVVLFPFNFFLGILTIFSIIKGWRRANYILCLGSIEKAWMHKWFPWWRSKLFVYVNALSKDDQLELTKIRLNRIEEQCKEGIRFLWIGRWVSHKGVKRLLKFIVQRVGSNPQDTFTIAGCGMGAEKNLPSEMIESGKINIVPSFKRHELYELLANHDVGLFTSRVEGWGLVLNEMLESGMTVFATPAAGVIDLQIFFETLVVFPPPHKITLTFLAFEPNKSIEQYYATSSWDKIADTYIKKMLTDSIFANKNHK